MKTSNANKVISVLMSVAMCPMMVPSAAFAADDGTTSGASSQAKQTQFSGQAEGTDTGANSGTTSATQPEATGKTSGTTTTLNENAAPAAATNEAATGEENATGVAEVNGTSYPSLQAAIDAASRKATVKLLADTKENVTISTPYVTLDLNGHTLNGSTGERKPALTVTNRVYVMDSSAAQTGTIMREDTAENSGVSSHYVIDVQGGNSGWLFFQSGNVKNDSGAGGTNGASLVRVGDDSKPGLPGLTISGGTFTQNNFVVLLSVTTATFTLRAARSTPRTATRFRTGRTPPSRTTRSSTATSLRGRTAEAALTFRSRAAPSTAILSR